MKKIALTFFVLACLKGSSAFAFNEMQDLSDKMDRLQRDLNSLQKDYYSDSYEPSQGRPASGSGGVDMDAFDEKMRKVQGQIEELEHKIKKLEERSDKQSADVDLRIKDLEEKITALQSRPAEPKAQEGKPHEDKKAAEDSNDEEEPAKPTKAAKGGKSAFNSPRDHYNHAFKLLNDTKFDEAKSTLEDFTGAYPEDPLIGNAYYWLGEIDYVNRDYDAASANFKKGYEKRSDGPKAPDNLLKLGMTLAAQEKKAEACKIFAILPAKFPNTSASMKQTIASEKKRNACK